VNSGVDQSWPYLVPAIALSGGRRQPVTIPNLRSVLCPNYRSISTRGSGPVAALVFGMPIRGSIPLMALALGLFIASNLALGITFSTVARSRTQATQMSQFMLPPSFFLSGFMFPFKGMPVRAQWLGELFPIIHALRIARGLLLKGNGPAEIAPELWPIAAFTLVVTVIATFSYCETLD
jgi:ABC-2 type transport system permease protein